MDVWSRIKEILGSKIDSFKMNLWIEPLIAENNEGKLVIICPNAMIYKYIEKVYLNMIVEAYTKVSGGDTSGGLVLTMKGAPDLTNSVTPQNVNKIVNKVSVQRVDRIEPAPNTSAPSPAKHETPATPVHNNPRQIHLRENSETGRPSSRRDNCIDIFQRSKNGSQKDKSGMFKSKTFNNFVMGSSNSVALRAAQNVARDPGNTSSNPLILLGKPGLGKTHLLYAIGNEICRNTSSRVVYVNGSDFLQDFTQIFGSNQTQSKSSKLEELQDFYSSADVLLLDDIQFIAKGEKTQEQIFYIIKNLFENLRQIVVTCDTYPKEIEKLDARITSRLSEGLTFEIEPPQYEERIAIIGSKARDIKLKIPQEVQMFIARIVTANVREIEGALKNCLTACEFNKTNTVTMDIAKEALSVQIQSRERLVNADEIMRVVAEKFHVTIAQLKSDKRYQSVAYPRNLAMFIIRNLTQKSFQEVGEMFGGKHHSTVITACKNMNQKIKNDQKVSSDYHSIIELLNV